MEVFVFVIGHLAVFDVPTAVSYSMCFLLLLFFFFNRNDLFIPPNYKHPWELCNAVVNGVTPETDLPFRGDFNKGGGRFSVPCRGSILCFFSDGDMMHVVYMGVNRP